MMPACAGVDPLTEAFRWAHRAVAVLAESRGKPSLQASFLARARRMSTHCTGFLTAERSIDFIAAAVARRPDLGFRVVLHAAAGCVRQARLEPAPPCRTKRDRS